MHIARILFPVRVLGPGDRIAIWFDGCEHACPGCSNPELWEQKPQYKTDLDSVMELIHVISDRNQVDGITITGGDPFYQPDALRDLLRELQYISRDILVYTGYCFDDLSGRYDDILEHIGVLIDGKYIESENHGSLLRGSDNQNIMILREDLQPVYEKYLNTEKPKIQNFTLGDHVISVGIHRPGYENELLDLSKKKGLEVKP